MQVSFEALCDSPSLTLCLRFVRVVSVLTVCVSQEDKIGDLKKLIAAQTGTRWDKIVLKKW